VAGTLDALFWTGLGLFVDVFLNWIVVKYVLRTKSTATQIVVFEVIHNTFSFSLGYYLSFSLLTVGLLGIGEAAGLVVAWVLFSSALAWKIIGINTLPKLGAFLTLDTGMDYLLGAVFAIPAAATIVLMPQVSAALPGFGPLSLRTESLLIGPLLVAFYYSIDKRVLGEKPRLYAD
jgi:cytochrome c biogenesis protein CcdA